MLLRLDAKSSLLPMLTALASGAIFLYWRYLRDEEALNELLLLADQAAKDAEHRMMYLEKELLAVMPESQDESDFEEDSEVVVYRTVSEPEADVSLDLRIEAPKLGRLDLDGVKQAVNRVLLPKLLAHNNLLSKAKTELRARKITSLEYKQRVHESSQQFTARYAEAIRTAAELVEQLPPDGELELRRLASSEESWAVAQELQNQIDGNWSGDG